jgi:hypothetical protein
MMGRFRPKPARRVHAVVTTTGPPVVARSAGSWRRLPCGEVGGASTSAARRRRRTRLHWRKLTGGQSSMRGRRRRCAAAASDGLGGPVRFAEGEEEQRQHQFRWRRWCSGWPEWTSGKGAEEGAHGVLLTRRRWHGEEKFGLAAAGAF